MLRGKIGVFSSFLTFIRISCVFCFSGVFSSFIVLEIYLPSIHHFAVVKQRSIDEFNKSRQTWSISSQSMDNSTLALYNTLDTHNSISHIQHLSTYFTSTLQSRQYPLRIMIIITQNSPIQLCAHDLPVQHQNKIKNNKN